MLLGRSVAGRVAAAQSVRPECGEPAGSPRPPHFAGPGEAGDLSVHARRPVAPGHLRSQAAPDHRPRQAAAVRQAARSSPAETGNLLESPWKFQQHGEAGPGSANCFRTSPSTSTTCASSTACTAPIRGTAGPLLELHTGSDTFVRPSMGSWITYGLGTENQDLPGFITICPTLTHGGVNNWSSAFLPAAYQGTPMGNAAAIHRTPRSPSSRKTATRPNDLQRMELDYCRQMNRDRGRTPALTSSSKAASIV